MTGFGKVTTELPSKKVTIEIKALNSKQLDLSTRIPSIYRDKEMEIRNYILQTLERGKVELNIFVEYIGKDSPTQVNSAAIESYYNQIKAVSDKLGIPVPSDWFATLLRLPDVQPGAERHQPVPFRRAGRGPVRLPGPPPRDQAARGGRIIG